MQYMACHTGYMAAGLSYRKHRGARYAESPWKGNRPLGGYGNCCCSTCDVMTGLGKTAACWHTDGSRLKASSTALQHRTDVAMSSFLHMLSRFTRAT